jgi:DNA-binding MarR family transcriptional regulator
LTVNVDGILDRMAESTARQATLDGQQILPLVDHLARLGRRATEACLAADCLRPRHMIALRLIGERGPMTQHAVGLALSLDPSNVVGLLNELEERGLITRRRDPADRRRHIVELSPAGSGELAQTFGQLRAVEDELFKALTTDERATLYALLSRAVTTDMPSCEEAACAGSGPEDCLAPEDGPLSA